ncbi:MAG: type IV toxin-antitoxin system AbiEi family antitoxin domain-containing protein [Saccharofermentanales bacterium]
MILSYKQCIEKYKSNYGIKKAIASGNLFNIEKGIYSEKKYEPELAVIMEKYPNAILTSKSAFYYLSLTDVIPDFYFLATEKAGAKINDKRVKQVFVVKELFDYGVTEIERQGVMIRIYDKERMLIELIRNKNKLPYDYYKEIIGIYRNIIHELDIERIQNYANIFPKGGLIAKVLQAEVF